MIQVGAFLGGLAVMLGAFGAHILGDHLSQVDLDIFEIGVRYHFYHAIGILLTGTIYSIYHMKGLKWTYRFFHLGIIIFCGSLYVLSVSELLLGTRLNWLGMITPIGGLFMMAGWFSLFLSFFGKKDK